ncbi:hypothetical protein MAH1_18450 [Sessilibacter sp. MAH1]
MPLVCYTPVVARLFDDFLRLQSSEPSQMQFAKSGVKIARSIQDLQAAVEQNFNKYGCMQTFVEYNRALVKIRSEYLGLS